MKKIAFQGELGAYSHLACIEAAPDHNPVACRTFESAMEQVNASECHLAMIPIENSSREGSGYSLLTWWI